MILALDDPLHCGFFQSSYHFCLRLPSVELGSGGDLNHTHTWMIRAYNMKRRDFASQYVGHKVPIASFDTDTVKVDPIDWNGSMISFC